MYKPTELPTEYDESMAVLVSEVVQWEFEFRCFILDRELRTLSIYSRFGELQCDADYESTNEEITQAKNFVDEVLRDVRVELPKATVIDVGYITGKGWRLLLTIFGIEL